MIKLLDLHNQTSNQFIQHIHLAAYCKEYEIKFRHAPFAKYQSIYPNLEISPATSTQKLLDKLKFKILKAVKSTRVIRLDDDSKAEYYAQHPEIFQSRCLYCKGGRLRRNDLVYKYREFYQKQFLPNIDIKKLDSLFFQKTQDSQKIVGIHIRRGDYDNYEGGMYFFSDEVYLNFLLQTLDLVGHDAKVIIFTNDDDIDIEKFEKKIENLKISKRSVAEDYYLMGRCDYLLSTNSTFTLVASYLGTSKLYRFMGKDEKIKSLDQFAECTTINHTDEEAHRAEIARHVFQRKEVI